MREIFAAVYKCVQWQCGALSTKMAAPISKKKKVTYFDAILRLFQHPQIIVCDRESLRP